MSEQCIDFLGIGSSLSEERVECLVEYLESFGENLRRGTLKERVSGRTMIDVRNVFCILRRCLRGDYESHCTCLGVHVPSDCRRALDSAFRDISVDFSFHKKYDERVLKLFFAVLDSLISILI